ncbi:unnamed protein product [Staurois parvus]|uniref:Uncharacterized protein n=1 Tax=Staurois parvus TaxID=386267 RepID=A0ABN9AIQ1_9NEOB|nr:unnamed protein product [Staurois parvus]
MVLANGMDSRSCDCSKRQSPHGGPWKRDPLHWWLVGRILPTLMVSGKKVPYSDGQWEECPLHWWSLGRMSLTLVVIGKNVSYTADLWEECPLH